MKTIFIMFVLGLSSAAPATTYYVSSSTGSDSNTGTSSGAAWQSVAKVNAQSFSAGDSILFRRGDVWNESLAPAASGTAGNPITFDAYGAGAPPNLTGYYAVPSSAWVLVTGNAWKAPVPAVYSTVNFCLFGSVWGQKVAAVTTNLTAQWDFYLANGFVYVYSVNNPASYYPGAIVPMALSNVPVININGRSWLTFQHLLVNWFDQYGVYVQGASDHLVFANMEVDSMIPQGTQPLGFYVNESAPGPGDIKIYNDEAHMNYDGFRFDGVATAITMVNDKAYGNRDGALVDNTGGVTYSHCHFYASSLAVAGSTDVLWTSGSGPTAGAGNIAQDTAPGVQAWQRYPAQVTLTVDDAGMTAGADTYYANTVLPIADGLGVPVGAAITVGYPLSQTLISEFQGWVNAGRDVTSHSMSHTYYTNTDALDIQYTGSGSAATMSISGKTLTITVTGAADSVSYNLAQGQAQGTIKAVRLALLATGKFTATEITVCQGPYGTGCSINTESALLAQDLADVSSQDVKSGVYHMQLDVTRLTTDEITLSRQWMTTNLTGLPATPVYVYPGGYETPTMQGIAAAVPYSGARGALKEDLGVKDTYASGFDVENVTSFGVNPTWMGLTPAALNQKVQALVWKQMLWGVPWGIFWHLNELTNSDPVGGTEITNLMQDLQSSGATIKTNTGLVNWLMSGTLTAGTDGNFYYKSAASSTAVDFRPTATSPVVDAGQNLGAAYQIDINGINQNSYGSGWEIGAHAFVGYSIYGLTPPGSLHFTIGGGSTGSCAPPNFCAFTGTGIVGWPTVPNMGNVLKNGAIYYDTTLPSVSPRPVVRCTDGAIDPGSTFANQSKSAGLGGSGDAEQLFNANSTLVHFQLTGGSSRITLFNPSTMVCGDPVTGFAITADKNLTTPGSAGTGYGFGPGTFDWTNPNIFYAFGGGVDAPANGVAKYVINTANGQFTVTPTLLDFFYGLPLGALAPAWQAGHAYASGDYVSATLTLPDWSGVTSYALGDLILPLSNNYWNCAFKLSTLGSRGTVPANWSKLSDGGCVTAQTIAEVGTGVDKWRNIGNGGTFTFQLTSAGGTSGGSSPNFGTASGHPDLLSAITDGSLTWTNTGPMIQPAWQSFSGISKNSQRFCSAFSSNSYGHGAGSYNNDNADQGTGIYVGCYDFALNTFVLLNTATGIQSNVSCSGGSGYSCAGGTQSKLTAAGTAYPAITANCNFPVHNAKGGSTLDYVVVAKQGNYTGTCSAQNLLDWRPFATFNAANNLQIYNTVSNHWTIGKQVFINVGDQSVVGYTSGSFTDWIDSANPTATPLSSWQVGVPYTLACDVNGVWFPNDPHPPCDFANAYDSHLAYWHDALDDDLGPICGSIFNLATLAPPPVAPYQGEEICVSTTPTWTVGGTIGGYKVWRFTHSFNSGGSPDFSVQFAISQLSTDGKFLAFSSDWNCTLGNISGGSTSLCGPPWVPGATYTVGQMINPFSSNGGSGTNYGVYTVTTGGIASATRPAWFVCNSGTAGTTVSDSNGVVYTCQGTGNGKGEVFIVKLAN